MYEDTAERVRIGYLSSGVYGIKVVDTGSTVIFEASDTQQKMSGFNFDQTYLYSLVSGTPGSSPDDGIVIEGGATARVITYENTQKRVEVGYLAAGVYGIKGYADDGSTMVFEMSDDNISLAGWSFTDTTLSAANISFLSGANPLITVGNDADWKIEIGGTAGSEYIGSSTFSSGPLGQGWQIDSTTGRAEFQDIMARGKLTMAVFETATVSSVGGSLFVSPADVLAVDMTAADASTLTIDGDTTFALNEILRIKDGVDDEWLQVTNVGSAPTYTVTRDLAGDYAANTNPIWTKGTAIVSTGVAAGGYIFMDASSADTPFIDIVLRNSATYSDVTTKVRLGNMDGITDTDFGISPSGFGLYTDNVYLKGSIVTSTGAGQRITINEYEGGAFNNAMIFYDSGDNEVLRIDDGFATGGVSTASSLSIVNGLINITGSMEVDGPSLGGGPPFPAGITDIHAFQQTITVGSFGNTALALSYLRLEPTIASGTWRAHSLGYFSAITADIDNQEDGTATYAGRFIADGSHASNAEDIHGVYGSATTSGSGAAYAGYFDDGDVYIKENLGIGTATPTGLLTLDSGALEFNGGLTAYPTLNATSAIYATEDPGGGSYPFDNFGNLIIQARRSGGAGTDRDIVFVTNVTPAIRMVILDSGNVGIGIAAPNNLLHVFSSSAGVETQPLRLTNNAGAVDSDVALEFSAAGNANPAKIVGIAPGGNDQDLAFWVTDNNAQAEAMRILGSGKVGIGTTMPNALLTINSLAADGAATVADGISFLNDSTGAGPWGHAGIWADGSTGFRGSLIFGVDGDGSNNINIVEKMRLLHNGNLGIGTAAPAYQLSLQHADATAISAATIINATVQGIRIFSSDTTADTGSVINFQMRSAGTAHAAIAGIAPSADNADLAFYTEAAGVFAERMRLQGANLGVGTDSPTVLMSANEGVGFTDEKGVVVKLTNNTGVSSVKGRLVEADNTDENSYKTADANATDVIGVVYNAGVADGSEVWIVVAGIAEVLLDAGGCVHHDRLISSATAGSADVWNVGGAVATHFQEIGHAIETVVGAGLAKVVLHFN